MTGQPPYEPRNGRESERQRQRIAALRLRRDKERLRAEWLAGGASEEEFESVWPAIQVELNRLRVMAVGEKARGRSLRTFRKPSAP